MQFKEVFLCRDHVNIVMDYAAGGSLIEYMQQRRCLTEADARWFFQQLMLAVDYCHKKGTFNRDIKLDNLLLHPLSCLPPSRPLLKVCDFGYCNRDHRSLASSRVGTLTYMAPEVMLNDTRDVPYSARKADIWSCGVVLFALVVGRYPFEVKNGNVIQLLHSMQNRRYELPFSLSRECKELITEMLDPDDELRITMPEILAHPWFSVDLPPDALSMNDKYLASNRRCAQSEEQIKTIISQAFLRNGQDYNAEANDLNEDCLE